MNKYKNIQVEVDGILFQSKKESRRYQELKLLERAGEIQGLTHHKVYVLIPKSAKFRKVDYVADFCYTTKAGEFIVEDVKGLAGSSATIQKIKSSGAYKIFKIKQKLMFYIYGIEVKEV